MELSDQARELRNAYLREYRKKHPEKFKQWQNNYWERKAKKSENNANCQTCGKEYMITNDPEFCSSLCRATDNQSIATDVATDNFKRCIVCGSQFEAKRADAKFCSSTCRSNYSRKNK